MPKVNIHHGSGEWLGEGWFEGANDVKSTPMDEDVRFLRATAQNKIMPELLRQLLSQPTPHGYEKMLHRFLPFLKRRDLVIMSDKKGNLIVDIGKVGTDFKTAFSCHMDTVHTTPQRDIELAVFVTTSKGNKKNKDEAGMVYAGIPTKDGILPGVLGADDKVGVYILCKMIEANIPGRYMFHVGEERGCVGSKYIAEHTPKTLAGIDRAIAFDRMHYGDVIAHQRGDRGSSITFSNALAKTLNEHMPLHEKFTGDVIGMFTDTGNYHKLVHECCNLSVGYFDQHGASEHFDLVWLDKILMPAILKIGKAAGFEKLPTERDKNKIEVHSYGNNWHGNQNRSYNRVNKVVPFEKITAGTLTIDLPPWDITDGYITKCSREGMEILVKEWLSKNAYEYQKRSVHARTLTNVLAERHNLLLEVENLKKVLLGRVDGPRFKQQYKCAMLGRLVNDWDKILSKGTLANKVGDDNLIRMRHLSVLIKQYREDKDFLNMELGLAFNLTYTEKLNLFLMKVTAAASVFKEHDSRLKKHLGEIVRYMWENSNEPVFEKYKDKLNEWPEIVRNKKIKVKGEQVVPAKIETRVEIKESDIPTCTNLVGHHPKINDCNLCEGTGWTHRTVPQQEVQCWLCEGKPKQLKLTDLGQSRDKNFVVCGTCNGTGQGADHNAGICYTCKGSGESLITQPHIKNLGSIVEPVRAPVTDADKPTVH